MGVSNDAEATLKATLTQAESAQPANPRLVDEALIRLAQFLQQCGRYREAEPLYIRSNELAQTAEEVAWSFLRLGAIYHAELQFDRAEAATRRAVALFQTLSGDATLEYAYATANLAAVLADLGENARAEPVLRRALYLIRKHAPGDTGLSAHIEENLGLVYLRQREFRKAEFLLREVLATLAATNDPAQACTLAALAELAIAEHRWVEANAWIRQAHELTVATQGERHPWLVGILHLKALVEAQMGDPRQAAADMKQSIDLLGSLAGPDSPTLSVLLVDYAGLLRHAGRKREAKAAFERSRVIGRNSASSLSKIYWKFIK